MHHKTDVFRALLCSLVVVGILILTEYLILQERGGDEMAERLYRSQISDLVMLSNGEVAAYVLSTSAKPSSPVHQFIGFIDLSTGQSIRSAHEMRSGICCTFPSSDRTALCVSANDGSTHRLNNFGAIESRLDLPEGSYIAGHLNFSNAILVVCGNSITALQIETWKVLWSCTLSEAPCRAICNVADRLYCATISGEILQLEASSGNLVRICARLEGEILRLAVSPCGSFLAAVLPGWELVVTELSTGEKLWAHSTAPQCTPIFSPDGQSLLVPAANSQLLVHDSKSGEQLFALGKHEGVLGVNWPARSDFVCSWGTDGCIKSWNIQGGTANWHFRPAIGNSRLQIWIRSAIGFVKDLQNTF